MDNRKYGILDNGKVCFAGSTINSSNSTNYLPTEADYLAAGYYRIEDVWPICIKGKHAVQTDQWIKDEMSKTLIRVYEIKDDPVLPPQETYLSRNKLVEYCVEHQLVAQLQTLFEEFPAYKLVWDSLDDGQIRLSHPMFKQAEALIKSRFSLSDEEWEAIKTMATI